MEKYYSDYPTEPSGGGNPYYRCVYCKITDPQINGRLNGHTTNCAYRKKEEMLLLEPEIRMEKLADIFEEEIKENEDRDRLNDEQIRHLSLLVASGDKEAVSVFEYEPISIVELRESPYYGSAISLEEGIQNLINWFTKNEIVRVFEKIKTEEYNV